MQYYTVEKNNWDIRETVVVDVGGGVGFRVVIYGGSVYILGSSRRGTLCVVWCRGCLTVTTWAGSRWVLYIFFILLMPFQCTNLIYFIASTVPHFSSRACCPESQSPSRPITVLLFRHHTHLITLSWDSLLRGPFSWEYYHPVVERKRSRNVCVPVPNESRCMSSYFVSYSEGSGMYEFACKLLLQHYWMCSDVCASIGSCLKLSRYRELSLNAQAVWGRQRWTCWGPQCMGIERWTHVD